MYNGSVTLLLHTADNFKDKVAVPDACVGSSARERPENACVAGTVCEVPYHTVNVRRGRTVSVGSRRVDVLYDAVYKELVLHHYLDTAYEVLKALCVLTKAEYTHKMSYIRSDAALWLFSGLAYGNCGYSRVQVKDIEHPVSTGSHKEVPDPLHTLEYQTQLVQLGVLVVKVLHKAELVDIVRYRLEHEQVRLFQIYAVVDVLILRLAGNDLHSQLFHIGDDPLGLAASDIAYHNFLSGSIAGNTRAFFHSHRIASNTHIYYTTDQHQIATVPAEYLLIKEKDSLSGLSFCECLNGELLDYSQFELLYAKSITVIESLYRSVNIGISLALSGYALIGFALGISVGIGNYLHYQYSVRDIYIAVTVSVAPENIFVL